MRDNGVIKWFSKSKSYGFITNKDGKDVFFRIENVSRSNDSIDKGEKEVIPKPKDFVEYTEYKLKGQLRAKKIVVKQRSNSDFICPHCFESVRPKVIYDSNSNVSKTVIGEEFKEKKPMHTVCPNCFNILEEYETKYEEFSSYNRAALLLLILLIVTIFVKFYLMD